MTTSDNTQRDQLALLVHDAQYGESDVTPRYWPLHTYKAADAILAAGYRKPRTITTAEELDALADHAIVKDRCGPVERHTNAWSGERGWFVGDSATTPRLPVIVLWEPEAEVGA